MTNTYDDSTVDLAISRFEKTKGRLPDEHDFAMAEKVISNPHRTDACGSSAVTFCAIISQWWREKYGLPPFDFPPDSPDPEIRRSPCRGELF